LFLDFKAVSVSLSKGSESGDRLDSMKFIKVI
jgi:hypothetical protein